MSYVLSVIAAKAKTTLAPADIEQVRRAVHQGGGTTGPETWLAEGEACDVPVQGDPRSALAAARVALGSRPIDVNILAAKNRRKRLLVADMDSTMIEQECIDELAAAIGLGDAVAAITDRAMRGELAFEPALVARVKLLAGLPLSTIRGVLAEKITPSRGAKELVATMRSAGAYTALVSGGFTAFAGPIATQLGFDEHRANELLTEGQALVGRVAEPILGRQSKRDTLLDLMTYRGLDVDDTLAVGDGANDLAMVAAAGLGVAYRAKPALRAEAAAAIDHGDLTALLFLQGYRREEFVS